MNRLKEINDEIYARWKAGENPVDLAAEYGRRYGLQRMLLLRAHAEARADHPRGETNKEKHARTWKRNEDIILSRAAGATYSSLAKKYGISPGTVRHIWMRHLRKSGDPRGFYGSRLWAKIQSLKNKEI
jgi:Mor family transcriptional regulator